jgi:hypothetical protein
MTLLDPTQMTAHPIIAVTKVAWGGSSPGLALILAAVVLAPLCYFLLRDLRQLRNRAMPALLALVILAFLMLLGVMLDPRIRHIREDETWKPTCMLIVDGSRSMALPDTYSGADAEWLRKFVPEAAGSDSPSLPREAVVRALLAGPGADWLRQLSLKYNIIAKRFGGETVDLALDLSEGAASEDDPDAGPTGFTVAPDGFTTPLGDALKSIAGDKHETPIILLTEAAWNAGVPPGPVASSLGKKGNPIYAIGIGDPTEKRDLAVVRVTGEPSVILGDDMFIRADVRATGMGSSTSVEVELLEDGLSVGLPKMVKAPATGAAVSVRFVHRPREMGEHVYSVVVTPISNEYDMKNNAAQMNVEIIQRKIRVLMVEAHARWEYRFIRTVLERDAAVGTKNLKIFLARPGIGPIEGGGVFIKELPDDKEKMLKYDLFIIGDLARTDSTMPDTFLKLVADRVQYGGAGLVVIAGRHNHYLELIGSPLAARPEPGDTSEEADKMRYLLPVELATAEILPTPFTPHPYSPELTYQGERHLLTRLTPGTDIEMNRITWERLPKLRWSAGVGPLVRGATALLVRSDRMAGSEKMPVLAVQSVGAGKVMFSGMDDTWRWRKAVGDKWHYRFWAQAIRWLVKKRFQEGDSQVKVRVSRKVFGLGQSVELEAFCLGDDGFPLSADEHSVSLRITGPGGVREVVLLEADEGGWGLWRKVHKPRKDGVYKIEALVSALPGPPIDVNAQFEVTRPDKERFTLNQNMPVLKSLAENSKGKYIKISEAHTIPGLLAVQIKPKIITTERAPCTHWSFYVLLALVLSSVWFIRKRSGLA